MIQAHALDPNLVHWMHVLMIVLSTLTNCFVAYLTFRAREAKEDRELKFRILQLEIQSGVRKVVQEVIDGRVNGQP